MLTPKNPFCHCIILILKWYYTPHSVKEGLVVSDLHLFSRRSSGEALLQGHLKELKSVDVFVLNGDTFDFRWSQYPAQQATVAAALEWLTNLLDSLGRAEVHYIYGNHDWLGMFRDSLEELSSRHPRLFYHKYWLRLDRSLFLHGDCANYRMDQAALERLRRPWKRDRQRGWLSASLYDLADLTGLSGLVHRCYFPRNRAVGNVAHYLDQTMHGWREQVDDCYFGHSHLPFRDHLLGAVRYHNTGSGIPGIGFQPLRFPLSAQWSSQEF